MDGIESIMQEQSRINSPLYNNLDIAHKTLSDCKLSKNEKKDLENFIKSLNKKNYLTKIYVSLYNRLSRLLNKDNELFPTF